MFNMIRKKSEEVIYSPIVGKCIPLEQVPDKVFAEKMMGEGIGFIYEDDTIYSPCDGKIIMIASTKHAFGIKTKVGTEILVHIGIDTVDLNGEDFDFLVAMGNHVKAHDPIVRINMVSIKKKNVDITTPLIVTNVDISEVYVMKNEFVDLKTVVCRIKKNK